MLSYILPVDSSKTPQNDSSSAPTNQQQQRLQLSLVPGRFAANGDATNTTATTTPISKETSVSSFASDATTATISHNTSSSMTNTSASDRHKAKIVVNGKHPTLKRWDERQKYDLEAERHINKNVNKTRYKSLFLVYICDVKEKINFEQGLFIENSWSFGIIRETSLVLSFGAH